MVPILGIIALVLLFGGATWQLSVKEMLKGNSLKRNESNSYIFIILAAGLALRVIGALCYRGHQTDMSCFISWSDDIFTNGISNFYLSDGFHDYPPGYVYVMYILGAIKNIFSIEGGGLWLLMKMPAIICDLVMGYVVYIVASKELGKNIGAVMAGFLVFNPTLILNSAIWGQVDSVLTVFCLLAVYYADTKKLIKSFFAFAIAFLIKPQAVFFAPILVFAVAEQVILTDYSPKRLIKTIAGALGAVAMLLILFMPFGNTPIHGIMVVINQYIETMGQYNHFTVNAFNIYGALGLNWTDVPAWGTILGYALILVMICVSAYVFFKSDRKSRYYKAAFVLVFGIYMLSVKMHERYAFPAIVMLMLVLVIKPDTKNMAYYGIFSMSQFFNTAWVLFIYETNPSKYFKSTTIIIASLINIVIFGLYMVDCFKDGKLQHKIKVKPEKKSRNTFILSEKFKKITVFDLCAILVISLVYGGVAFHKLGNKYAPQSYTHINENQIQVDFGSEKEIKNIAYYLGARHLTEDRELSFYFYDNNKEHISTVTLSEGDVFKWNMVEDIDVPARYVIIYTDSPKPVSDFSDMIYLNEVVFLDGDGGVVPVEDIQGDGGDKLFDEQALYGDAGSFMSGTYFDEIYHARTAYEFLKGMSVYEWTHPPLGKVFISLGIAIFGMVPFGWRCVGTLFGVLMVGAIYLFAKRMLKYSWLALSVCLILTFDFMHFTQTRIATIDTYVTFFIMLMYYFMYKYYKQSFYDTPLRKTLIPLGLSGIFFGMAVASKWTGLYAGAGLAVIFFITIFERYREYRYAVKDLSGTTDGISHQRIADTFKRNTLVTLLYCCIMFVVVPFVIYTLSYIPYFKTPSGNGIRTIFENAKDMLTYHGKTVVNSTHPYSSQWFEWPIMYKPIWYFSNTLDNGLKQGISAFGNPAVWWTGIGATAYTLAVGIIIPLRDKGYFGRNKNFYGIIYTAVFAVICIISAVAGSVNERLVRLLPAMLLYSFVFVGIFWLILSTEQNIKKISIRDAWFLTIGYFSGILPWTLVVRTTYIYHYFTCVPFVVLMIGYVIKTIYDNVQNKRRVIVATIVYTGLCIALFILFYPVLSGAPVSLDFAQRWLKWFSSWVLVA